MAYALLRFKLNVSWTNAHLPESESESESDEIENSSDDSSSSCSSRGSSVEMIQEEENLRPEPVEPNLLENNDNKYMSLIGKCSSFDWNSVPTPSSPITSVENLWCNPSFSDNYYHSFCFPLITQELIDSPVDNTVSQEVYNRNKDNAFQQLMTEAEHVNKLWRNYLDNLDNDQASTLKATEDNMDDTNEILSKHSAMESEPSRATFKPPSSSTPSSGSNDLTLSSDFSLKPSTSKRKLDQSLNYFYKVEQPQLKTRKMFAIEKRSKEISQKMLVSCR